MAEKQMGRLSRNLSTGIRISSSKDDPAGMSVSTKLRFQVEGTKMAAQNTMNGISVLQTADAALAEVQAMIHRMRELAVQSANDTHEDDDREKIQIEINQLRAEIDSIASKADYNRINLLNGHAGLKGSSPNAEVLRLSDNIRPGEYSFGLNENGLLEYSGDFFKNPKISLINEERDRITITDDNNRQMVIELQAPQAPIPDFTNPPSGAPGLLASFDVSVVDNRLIFQIGANGGLDQRVGLNVGNMSTGNLGNSDGNIATINIATRENANDAIAVIDAATNQVSAQRASLGALQNRLEHTLNNLGVTKENLTAAESTIRDVDMAKEMMDFTKNNILVQASQAMLAQANQLPQGVLQLLR
jgi:flagellin